MTAPPAEGREEELALARLPLPRSATATATAAPASNPIPAAAPAADPAADPPGPTIRILAVADVDLRSAARLAEYSLRGREDLERAERRSRRGAGLEAGLEAGEMRTRPLGGGRVDLCVACGPFIHRGGGFDGAAVGERGRNETDGSGSGSDSGSGCASSPIPAVGTPLNCSSGQPVTITAKLATAFDEHSTIARHAAGKEGDENDGPTGAMMVACRVFPPRPATGTRQMTMAR